MELKQQTASLTWLLMLVGACIEALKWSHGRALNRATWDAASAEWRDWLKSRLSGSGSGSGSGDGYGYGDGDGYGSGYGSGYGYGYGSGYGYGYGYGSGYGYGYGSGSGSGSGYGSGYGYGYGSGSGSGSGYGYGDVVSLTLDDGTVLSGDVAASAAVALADAMEREGIAA